MPDFDKPAFSYNYEPQAQINALRDYEQTKPGRAIPSKAPNRLLIATWNIANFGSQERRDRDFDIIAELISWFDLVAIQETKDDLTHLRAVMSRLPWYSVLHSDKAGNDERMAFVYDRAKVRLLQQVGEIAIDPASVRYIKLPGITQKFRGFDRNPYRSAGTQRHPDVAGRLRQDEPNLGGHSGYPRGP